MVLCRVNFEFSLEKLRVKLEREVNSQKPKLQVISEKKQELTKRLASLSDKENEMNKNIEQSLDEVSNDDLKHIVRDAMRMKQLEVNQLATWNSCTSFNIFFYPSKVALQEVKDQNLYLTKSLQARTEDSSKSEALLLQLMKTSKSLYLNLRVNDSVPSYMEADFNVIFCFYCSETRVL